MPKFTVMLTETLTHRVVVQAATEAAAMRAAEIFLTETDHNDDYLFMAGGYQGFQIFVDDPQKPEVAIHGQKQRDLVARYRIIPFAKARSICCRRTGQARRSSSSRWLSRIRSADMTDHRHRHRDAIGQLTKRLDLAAAMPPSKCIRLRSIMEPLL